MKTPTPPELYTTREITVSLNNALLAAKAPVVGPIQPSRMRQLRAYSEALVQPTLEHLEQGLLTPQELVFIHIANALRVQQLHVIPSEKVPASVAIKPLFE